MFLRDSQLATAYENSRAPQVAFIDESFQTKHPAFYSMTATLVSSSPLAMQAVRSEVYRIGGHDFHATECSRGEGAARISKLLEYLRRDVAGANVLTVKAEMPGPKYMMRAATLGQLLVQLSDEPNSPDVLVVDAQDARWQKGAYGLDLNDRAVVTEFIERRLINTRVRILHSKGTHEPLLHFPDAVQWAAQQALRFRNFEQWDRVARISRVFSVGSGVPMLLDGVENLRKQADVDVASASTQVSPSIQAALLDLTSRGPRPDLMRAPKETGIHIASKSEMAASLGRYRLAVGQ